MFFQPRAEINGIEIYIATVRLTINIHINSGYFKFGFKIFQIFVSKGIIVHAVKIAHIVVRNVNQINGTLVASFIFWYFPIAYMMDAIEILSTIDNIKI